MPDILLPNGTVTCEWVGRTPSQVDANCHLNVDEGMADSDPTDHITASGLDKVFEVTLGAVTFTGPFGQLKQAFAYDGDSYDNIPGGEFGVFINGTPVVAPQTYRLLSDGNDTAQVIWPASAITYAPLLSDTGGLVWNAAASLGQCTMRLTTRDAGAVADIPPDWQESD